MATNYAKKQNEKKNSSFPNMGLNYLKNQALFIDKNKQHDIIERDFIQKKKMKRKGIDVDPQALHEASLKMGNLVFDINQAHVAIGGDGDYKSGDDIGSSAGARQHEQRQNTLNETAEKNEAKERQEAAIDWSYTQGSHYDRGWNELTDKEKNTWYEKYKNKNN